MNDLINLSLYLSSSKIVFITSKKSFEKRLAYSSSIMKLNFYYSDIFENSAILYQVNYMNDFITFAYVRKI